MDQETMVTGASAGTEVSSLRSQERILDAEAIEDAASKMTRPTAKMHLEALAKKLRKEGEALQRVEKSAQEMELEEIKESTDTGSVSIENADVPGAEKSSESMEIDENKEPSTPVASGVIKNGEPKKSISSIAGPPPVASFAKYIPIDRFAFDAGGYNAPFVTVYVSLVGVGSISRDLITCDFKSSTFDLVVKDLNGKSYRLFQDNLEKDIDPSKSKIIVKSDKVIVKLAKVKQSDYGGYDYWTKLSDKKAREKDKKVKDDPQSSIMDLMKQMYDDGDDNMKKIIGETMMKQQRGELSKDDPMKGLDKMDY